MSGVGWYFAPDTNCGALRGAVAQLGERLTGSQKAGGSSPPSSTKLPKSKNLRVDVRLDILSMLRSQWWPGPGVFVGETACYPSP